MNVQASRALRVTDAAAMPLDAVRRGLLGVIARNRVAARAIGTRDLRVPIVACVQVTLLFACATLMPVAMFVVGPLLLGVPHLASDVRYLLLRTDAPRVVLTLTVVASLALLSLRGLALVRHAIPHSATLEAAVGALWVVVAFWIGAKQRTLQVRLLVLAALLAAGAWSVTHAALMRVVMAHAHNVIGIAIWFFWFRRNKRFALVPLVAIAVGAALLASGAMLQAMFRVDGDAAFGTYLVAIARGLAPGFEPRAAMALCMSFVFLQSVHYATWLVWVPQEQLPGQGTFTYRMSGRALVRDLGPWLLMAFVGLWAGLALWGGFHPLRALQAYVTLVSFHGYFELAMMIYLVSRSAQQALR